MSYMTGALPSHNWRTLVAERVQKQRRADAQRRKFDSQYGVHPEDDNIVTIYKAQTDTMVVTNQSLHRAGYFPELWDVVRIKGEYYELSAWDGKGHTWEILPIDLEAEADDIPALRYDPHDARTEPDDPALD